MSVLLVVLLVALRLQPNQQIDTVRNDYVAHVRDANWDSSSEQEKECSGDFSMKTALLIGLLILVCLLGWKIFDSYHNTTAIDVENATPEAKLLVSGEEHPISNPGESAEPNIAEGPQVSNPDEQSLLLQEEWEVSRGYGVDRSLRRLTNEQLQILVEQGDTRAIRALAAKKLTSNPAKMISMYEDAIILGDVPGLLSVAGSWSNPYVHNSTDTFKVSDNPGVNTLAIELTAQLRGDNVLAPKQVGQTLLDYEFDAGMIQEACAAARVLFNQLEQKRMERGHPPFDNTPSPLGQAYPENDHIAETCN